MNADPAGKTVITLLREQAALAPGKVAVSPAVPLPPAGQQARQLTYAELDAQSDALARRLVRGGICPGDRVAVRVQRSPALVVTLLAVLKAGAAYVPLDDSAPDHRIAEILADADAAAVCCDRRLESATTGFGLPVFVADALAALGELPPPAARLPRVAPSDIAYLMYTSGSTGRPKAVVVEHRNITNLVEHPNYVELSSKDRILQAAPAAFDASTFEIWGALLNGAQLAVAPPGPVDPALLSRLVREAGITVLWLTAALFHLQVDADPAAFRGLRTLLAGGDVLSVSHVHRFQAAAPACRLVNGYGPTETTTFACCHQVTAMAESASPVPIGRPVQGADLRVTDANGVEVADGTPGELWIGGAGVARGYWRRPDLTEKAFTLASFGGRAARRYYHTGDQVLRRSDGVFEFLGRLDAQIKLRGYRIEPAEVESVLAEHPQVRQAAVGVRPGAQGDQRLVAWVMPQDGALDRTGLKAHLASRLPAFMVPVAYVAVDRLPVTANGKLDRGALPDPAWSSRNIYP